MASFGDELKRERELRDISLKEIADATNISVRFLEALENNDFSTLPGGVYVRGFIRSVAHHLGLDIEETMNAYQQEVERQEMLLQAETGRGGRAGSHLSGSRAPETAVAGGFALIALIIGVLYWAGMDRAPEMPAPDPAAHSEALKARMKRAGALPSRATAEANRAGTPASVEPAPAEEIAASPDRLVAIRAIETTRVQLTCAGEVRFREELWVGVERQFACREPILISASNAGAIEYSVDAQALQVLGQPGRPVKDVPITVQPATSPSPATSKPRPVQGAAAGAAAETPGTAP